MSTLANDSLAAAVAAVITGEENMQERGEPCMRECPDRDKCPHAIEEPSDDLEDIWKLVDEVPNTG